jgi:hypothetical protein
MCTGQGNPYVVPRANDPYVVLHANRGTKR